MSGKTGRTYKSECVDCGSPLELYEIDFDKGRHIMHCTRCGLYHFHKKDFFGKWKLVRTGRVSVCRENRENKMMALGKNAIS